MSRVFPRSPEGNIQRIKSARKELTIRADHIDRSIEGNTPINVVIVPMPRYVPHRDRMFRNQAERRKDRDTQLRLKAYPLESEGIYPLGFPIAEYIVARNEKKRSNIIFRRFVDAEIRARKAKGFPGGEMFSFYKPTVRQRHGNREQQYTISTVSQGIKASERFHNCIGGLVKARSRDGKTWSFGWHVSWMHFLGEDKKKFEDELRSALDELLGKNIEPGTVDAVLFGGRYHYQEDMGAELAARRNKEEYVDAIQEIAGILRSKLEFEPRVAIGPDRASESTDMYFDGQTLYLFMPTQDGPQNVSFLPDRLDSLHQKWDSQQAPPQSQRRGISI